MKKLIIFCLAAMLIFMTAASSTQAASSLSDRLRGYILLQVEERGEAWYVLPDTGKRIYMKDGDAAYQIMRGNSLGITNADLKKIPLGFEVSYGQYDSDSDSDGIYNYTEDAIGTNRWTSDSDGDGYDDATELKKGYDPQGTGVLNYDYNLANRLKGHILLQVESRGEAWYINPDDGYRYYMKNGLIAYQMMRYMSLGITNANLAQIDNYYIGYEDTNGAWGLNFGGIIDLDSKFKNLPDDIELIQSEYVNEFFISYEDYEYKRQNACTDDYTYYCTGLIQGQWVGGFLLENNKVYRKNYTTLGPVLIKKISDKITIYAYFHDHTTDTGKEVTAYSIFVRGGADSATYEISKEDIKGYYQDLFEEVDLPTDSLDALGIQTTYFLRSFVTK